MRDRIVHDYFGVSLDIVWDVVKNHPVQPLLDALQASDDHVVLGFELVEPLVDGVEVAVDLVEAAVDIFEPSVDRVKTRVHLVVQTGDYSLYVGQDDLPMELREDLDQIFHVPDPTPPWSQWVRKEGPELSLKAVLRLGRSG